MSNRNKIRANFVEIKPKKKVTAAYFLFSLLYSRINPSAFLRSFTKSNTCAGFPYLQTNESQKSFIG